MLNVGDRVPKFSLTLDSGESITDADLRGKTTVLYFYPKDDTPGCTKEACAFRDGYAKFKGKGIQVLGVSRDTVGSHVKFRQKYSLPFSLISDPDFILAKAFGAFGEKNMYGKKTLGVIRSTFVIQDQGKITHVYPKVKPDEHAEQILADLGA